MTPNPRSTAPWAHLGASLICGLAALPAAAQTSPWYVGAAQSFTHESNVFRLGRGAITPADVSRSDTISTTSLLAGLDQPISRQRVYATAALRASRFQDNPRLDNQGYSLDAGVDWQTVQRLSGRVSLGANQTLARFTSGNVLSGVETRRNIENNLSFDTIVRLGLVTRWTAEAGFGHRRVRYSDVAYDFREYDQDSLSAGLRWRPSSSASIGVGLRQTDGMYPRFGRTAGGNFVADRFKRRDLDLSGNWTPGGASSVDARLSLGQTDYDVASERNLSGLTGSIGWNWQPTGKLRLRTQLSRDDGQESYFLNQGFVNGVGDYSRSTTAVRVRADLELTGKIGSYAALTYSDRALSSSTTPVGGTRVVERGHDRGTNFELGATWAPTRNTQVGCNLGRESRNGDGRLAAPLTSNTFGCSGQILLR